jgi:hypothetical protein
VDSVRSIGTVGTGGGERGRAAQSEEWPIEQEPMAAARIQRPGQGKGSCDQPQKFAVSGWGI